MELSHYDVIVVGLGVTGGMFLHRLLAHGLECRIAVIEAGTMWDPIQTMPSKPANSFRETASADDRPITISTASDISSTRRWWAPKLAGGGSLLWYGQLHRFDKYDTSPTLLSQYTTSADHELCNWPVTADELAPYYDEVCNILQPFKMDANPAELAIGVRHRSKKSGLEDIIYSRLLNNIGISVKYPLSCLGNIRWDEMPFDPTYNVYRPKSAPLTIRPNIFAKIYEKLQQDSKIIVFDNCTVTSLLQKNGKISGVSLIKNETNYVNNIYSPIVVLACGAIESVRLALLSGVESEYPIGAGFTFTNEVTRYIKTNIKRRQSSLEDGLESFASISLEDESGIENSFRGKFSIYNAKCFESHERFLASSIVKPDTRLQYFSKADENYFLKISFKGESIPWSRKYVRLSSSYSANGIRLVDIGYTLHPLDKDLLSRSHRQIEKIAETLGGTILPAGELINHSSAHQHGGLIFGNNQKISVLSPNCEAHGCSGLFAIDGSFMPNSGHTNSSWTLMANALRVADLIANGGRYNASN